MRLFHGSECPRLAESVKARAASQALLKVYPFRVAEHLETLVGTAAADLARFLHELAHALIQVGRGES